MFGLLTPLTLRLMMGLTFFPLGLFSIIAGMFILVAGPFKKEAKVLAQQSARIGQKGLTDDITLVSQSATALVDAVNSLIKTTSGNAIVLIIVGAFCECAAYWLLLLNTRVVLRSSFNGSARPLFLSVAVFFVCAYLLFLWISVLLPVLALFAALS